MSASSNHTKGFVQYCHGKRTVASSRTLLSVRVFTSSRVKKSDFLILEDGTDRLYRNVGKKFTTRCLITQKTAVIIFSAEAWNRANYVLLCRMKIDFDFWTVCVYEEAQFSGCRAAPQWSVKRFGRYIHTYIHTYIHGISFHQSL